MNGKRRVAGGDSHFALHGEAKFRIAFKDRPRTVLCARVLCEGRGGVDNYQPVDMVKKLAAGVVVSCVHCTALQEAWVAYTDMRPLTVRRKRALVERMKAEAAL